MTDWRPISTAPFDILIEVAVIDRAGVHAFAHPVRRMADGWLADELKGGIGIDPTHWRDVRDAEGLVIP
jgi:hypothetical protein